MILSRSSYILLVNQVMYLQRCKISLMKVKYSGDVRYYYVGQNELFF